MAKKSSYRLGGRLNASRMSRLAYLTYLNSGADKKDDDTGGGVIPVDPGEEASPHLYWRLYITANNGDGNYTVASGIKFLDPDDVQISLTGATVFADSNDGGNGEGGAFGTTGVSFWQSNPSGTYPRFIGVQFAAPVTVNSFTLGFARDGARMPKKLRLEYSDDGATYTPVGAGYYPDQVNWQMGETRTFGVEAPPPEPPEPEQIHRYWRMQTTAITGDIGWDTSDIRLYNDDVRQQDCTVTASSTYAGFNPQAVITGGEWASDFSNTYPQWLTFDFGDGNPKKVNALTSGNANGYSSRQSKNGSFLWSDNGVDWTVYRSWTDKAGSPAPLVYFDDRV